MSSLHWSLPCGLALAGLLVRGLRARHAALGALEARDRFIACCSPDAVAANKDWKFLAHANRLHLSTNEEPRAIPNIGVLHPDHMD